MNTFIHTLTGMLSGMALFAALPSAYAVDLSFTPTFTSDYDFRGISNLGVEAGLSTVARPVDRRRVQRRTSGRRTSSSAFPT